MKAVRVVASGVVVMLTMFAVWHLCVRPYRCDVAFIQARDAAALAHSIGGTAITALQQELPRIEECLTCEPYLVHWQMLAAGALDMTGRREKALEVAERATTWDRRPELYNQLAHLQAAAGDRARSIDSISNAVLFNPRFLDLIEDGALREHGHRALTAHYVAMGNMLRNGSFEKRRPFGKAVFSGAGQGPESVATGWFFFTSSSSPIRCSVLPSNRPGDAGKMLHVVAPSAQSGMLQVWGPPDRGPSVVSTSAWVYVVRGNVYIGSGQVANVSSDAVTGYSGRWQRIEGRSQSCPASQTVIGAASSDTEFYVSDVEVKALADATACQTTAGN